MLEQRAMYLSALHESHQPSPCYSQTFDLGRHTLEITGDESILLVKNTQHEEFIELDREETYLLLSVLGELFPKEIENGSGNK